MKGYSKIFIVKRIFGRMKNICIIFLLVSVHAICGETEKSKQIKVDFTGFLKYEVTFDSRQTISAREGIFMFYPVRSLLDMEGNDVHAASNFNMCTINSMLKLNLTGPDIFRANSNAYFEVDFWGSESNKYIDLNHFRLRHAYARLKWPATELLLGQYWHPMSVAGFFPKVVSSNCGVPFHPISRNPQIRILQHIGIVKLIGCFLTQRDFTSTGPDGADSKYLRNSGMPNIHLQLQCGKDTSKIIAGAGIDYKKIVPELYTSYENDIIKTGRKNTLSSLSFVGFLSVETKYLSMKAQGIYGQNAYDILQLGGYAVKGVTNAEKGEKEYSNLSTLSGWGDIQTTGRKIRYGFFCGYTKNMGSGGQLDGPIYARGVDIDRVYRIAPRIVYEKQPVEISLECEYTTAYYGTENGDQKGGVRDTNPVSNFRTLMSVKYYF
jgi:hypothetical protein